MAKVRTEIDVWPDLKPAENMPRSMADVYEGYEPLGEHDAAKFGNDLIDGDPDDYSGQPSEEPWDVSPYLRPVDHIKPIPR